MFYCPDSLYLAARPERLRGVPGIMTSFPQPVPRLCISSPLEVGAFIALRDLLCRKNKNTNVDWGFCLTPDFPSCKPAGFSATVTLTHNIRSPSYQWIPSSLTHPLWWLVLPGCVLIRETLGTESGWPGRTGSWTCCTHRSSHHPETLKV